MQKDIFDEMYEDFKFDNSRPVRVFETFAGIGFQRMALEQAGIKHTSVQATRKWNCCRCVC